MKLEIALNPKTVGKFSLNAALIATGVLMIVLLFHSNYVSPDGRLMTGFGCFTFIWGIILCLTGILKIAKSVIDWWEGWD